MYHIKEQYRKFLLSKRNTDIPRVYKSRARAERFARHMTEEINRSRAEMTDEIRNNETLRFWYTLPFKYIVVSAE